MKQQPQRHNDPSLMPWSHRFGPLGRSLVTVAAGAGSAFVGTFAHRMGASMNIPYGLVLALLIVGLSTYAARARQGAVGIGLHLTVSSVVAWGLAIVGGPGGDVLTVAGFGAEVPFMSQHAGYIWLYGVIALQVLLLVLPARWFAIPPRKVS
ncbi:alcohol dehydrogenase [Bifidobacterium callitrichos]|uniref:Alcohol dehydrogenase n=2 Tax=Bifidobacterium callitrichos TaxID=762209 RepID=A0A2T3GCV6_9BIFI|nr:hypothetical protein [Bifidobacterium callitrichos]PST47317.1 alcohol dehydrogenase [Bifidobacterium callitrichos]